MDQEPDPAGCDCPEKHLLCVNSCVQNWAVLLAQSNDNEEQGG